MPVLELDLELTSLSDFPRLVEDMEDSLDLVNCQHLENPRRDHLTLSEGLRGVKILVYLDGRLADSNRKLWRRHNLTTQISTFPHLIDFPSDPSSRGRTR